MTTVLTESPEAAATATRSTPSRRFTRIDLAVLACFILAGIYLRIDEWWDLDRAVPAAQPRDPMQFELMFAHASRVVTEFANPFYTDRLNYPDGVNLMGNTSILGIGIPMTPVTLIFGPHVSFVVVASLSLALTAAAWYFVFSRMLVTSRLAAFVGAALAGFGPSMVSHSTAHLNFAFEPLVPIIVWRFLKLTEAKTRGQYLREGLILGLLVAYQFFIGEEVLLYTVLACGTFMLIYGLQRPELFGERWRGFLAGLGVAVATGSVLLAYPLYVQFFGAQNYRGLPADFSTMGSDAAAYGAFTHETVAGTLIARDTDIGRISENLTELNAFFGWPLLLVLVVATVTWWRDKLVRALALSGAVFIAMSLGPNITIAGVQTQVAGPWALFGRLPLLDHIIPMRLGMIGLAFAGAIIAIVVDRSLRSSEHRIRWGWLVAVGVALVAIAPTPVDIVHRPPTPAFITDGTWREYVREGHTLLPVPVPGGADSQAIRWSAYTLQDMRLPMGYFLGPYGPDRKPTFDAPRRKTGELIEDVVYQRKPTPRVTDEMRRQARADFDYWKVDAVVLPPYPTEKVTKEFLDDLIGPSKRVGGVWVWKLHP